MQYNLKKCRKRAGLSQMQVAIAIDTAQQKISKWERRIQDITLEKAIKLADLYNVTLDELAGRETQTQTQNTN